MTNKELIQALRCGEDANGTPRPEPSDGEIVCYDPLKLAAADLIERLTAERDALLEIAKNGRDCDTCKNCAVCVKPGTDVAHWCNRCEEKCRCYGCGGDHWEWHGLPEAPEEGEKA